MCRDCRLRRGAGCVLSRENPTPRRCLVRQESGRRIEGGIEVAQSLLTTHKDMRNTRKNQAMTLRTTPSAGQVAKVKTVIDGTPRP